MIQFHSSGSMINGFLCSNLMNQSRTCIHDAYTNSFNANNFHVFRGLRKMFWVCKFDIVNCVNPWTNSFHLTIVAFQNETKYGFCLCVCVLKAHKLSINAQNIKSNSFMNIWRWLWLINHRGKKCWHKFEKSEKCLVNISK